MNDLRLLLGPITQDVNTMIAAADADDSARVVRDFKSKLDAATLAYDPLTKRLLTAAKGGSSSSSFPGLALRDAAKAEMHANMLYSWARTFVPTDTSGQAGMNMDKAAKLKMVPYIVAMAYAVRIKLDVYYVESSGVVKAERHEYLERSCSTVEEFLKVMQVAMYVTLRNSSLLDVALDYHLALTTYATLTAALRASVQMLLKPRDAPRTIATWDDGLEQVR